MRRCIRDKKGRFAAHNWDYTLLTVPKDKKYITCIKCGAKRLPLDDEVAIMNESNEILKGVPWKKVV